MLAGYKTYILAGAAALASAYVAVTSGTFDVEAAVRTLEALAIMALRSGVAKLQS